MNNGPEIPPALLMLASLIVFGSLSAWLWLITNPRRALAVLPLVARRPVPWTFFGLIVVAVTHLLFQGVFFTLFSRVEFPFDAPTEAAPADRLIAGGPEPDEDGPTGEGAVAPEGKGVDEANAGRSDRIGPALAAGAAANLMTLAVAVVFLRVAFGARWPDLGWRASFLGSDLRAGVVAFLLACIPLYALQAALVSLFPQQHPIIEELFARPGAALAALSVFSAVLVAPVAEEFFFRGLLQGWLESFEFAEPAGIVVSDEPPEGHEESANEIVEGASVSPVDVDAHGTSGANGDPSVGATDGERLPGPGMFGFTPGLVPVVATSFCFAMMHLNQGPAPIPLFLLSLLMGFLYHRTHRLAPCIVLHFCVNATSMALLWLSIGVE